MMPTRTRTHRRKRRSFRAQVFALGAAAMLALASIAPNSAFAAMQDQLDDPWMDLDSSHIADEPLAIDPTRPMTEEEIEAVAAYDRQMNPEYFERGHLNPEAAVWIGGIMSFVGKSALNFGLQQGFSAGLEKIFPGRPDPTADALEEIAEQIDGLRLQIQGVSNQVTELGNQVAELKELHEWGVYFDREIEVETHKGRIELYADYVAGYERHDQWDEQKARRAVDMTGDSISQMELKLVNGTDPAFQNLMKVLRYSNSETRWAQIDAYRRGYESILATGVLTIMAAHEKYPGLFQSELDAAVLRYERTIDGLYEVAGLGYPQPMQFTTDGAAVAVGAQLHPLGADFIVGSSKRPLRVGEVKQVLTSHDQIAEVYQALMDDYYRGRDPGDSSFRSYLFQNEISASLTVADSIRVTQNSSGHWRVFSDNLVISNRTVSFKSTIDGKSYATHAEALAVAEARRAAVLSWAPYIVEVETNSAGHDISTDVDALDLAMHGLDVVWNAEEAGPGGEMGALVLQDARYDTLIFADAVTGVRLGAVDVSKGPVDSVLVDAPPSGSLALILGESLVDEPIGEGFVVPIGASLINLPPSAEGHALTFSPVRREFEFLNIRVQGAGNAGGVFVNDKLACGWGLGNSCTLELDPYAGPLRISAHGQGHAVLQSWSGACSGGRWSTCTIDPGNGGHDLTATFEYYYPD